MDLESALQFASELEQLRNRESNPRLQGNGNIDDSDKHCNSPLLLSGVMNIAHNYEKIFENSSFCHEKYIAVDGERFIDKWPKSATTITFECLGFPYPDWRRSVPLQLGVDGNGKGTGPVRYYPISANYNTSFRLGHQDFIVHEDINSKFGGDITVREIFCYCHSSQSRFFDFNGYSDVDMAAIHNQILSSKPPPKIVNNSSKRDPSLQLYTLFDEQFIKCSAGIAGCNGKVHIKCAGLSHLSQQEVDQLVDYICPLCFRYRESTGELTEAQKSRSEWYGNPLAAAPSVTSVCGSRYWESNNAHLVWGILDVPNLRYSPMDDDEKRQPQIAGSSQTNAISSKLKNRSKLSKAENKRYFDLVSPIISANAQSCDNLVSDSRIQLPRRILEHVLFSYPI